ncbi:MAG: T9SS type A sorting domain-containing protein [Ignavibacteriales bacterium]|nr:T9SS type A sorting domain-containing protein [Ignavibacteriales bacterium]
MKKFIALFVFITANLNAQEPDPASYFPSSVGNAWEYDTQSGLQKTKIIRDSIDSKGNKYLYYYSLNKADRMIDTSYNVYLMHPVLDTVLYCFYKLAADSGETWTFIPDAPRTIARVDNVYQSFIFGKDRYVKEVGYYRPQPGDTVITESAVFERYVLLVSGIGEYYEYDVESGPERILLGCIINGDTLGTITSVNDQPKIVIADFELHQNYPNPFNPITTIEYDLRTSSNIILIVYNLLGEEVKTLVKERQQKGSYKITFDARDLASGVYIYKLTTGNTMFSKKMLYIK